jgi:solute carrier family 6 GABA transporter-like protein 1
MDVESGVRDRWYGRATFLLAAIGSAVGLGNIWRFPSLVYKFGGGSFFIPYIFALFLVGIPILILEVTLGQVHQSGDIIAFGKINPRLRGIGLGSIWSSFNIVSYYAAIVAWSVVYFFTSFQADLPWIVTPEEEADRVMEFPTLNNTECAAVPDCAAYTKLGKATNFFFDLLLLNEGQSGISWRVIIALVFVWAFIYASIFRGPAITGRVAWVTVPLPIIVLLVLLFTGISLEGSELGIEAYIGRWDLDALSDPTMWSEAVAQIFFTLGVTFGIMTAYASYNRRGQNAVEDSIIIAVSNSLVSVIAGFAVFSVLGHYSFIEGVPVSDLNVGGPILLFVTYPVGLGELEIGWAHFFSLLFFIMIFTLGIDSAFSLAEAVDTVVHDSRALRHVERPFTAAFVCISACLVGILYTTHFALPLLDSIDWYLNNVAMIFVGFMEVTSVGWVYAIEEQFDEVGYYATLTYNLGWLAGTIAAVTIGLRVPSEDAGGWIAVFVGLTIVGAGILASYLIAEFPSDPATSVWYWLCLHNPEAFRFDANGVVAADGGLAIPFLWGLLVKYFLPPLLLVLWAIGLDANFGAYAGYDAEFQWAGALVSLLSVLFILIGLVSPDAYISAMPAPDADPEVLIIDRQWQQYQARRSAARQARRARRAREWQRQQAVEMQQQGQVM